MNNKQTQEFIENEFLPFLYEHGLVKPENGNITTYDFWDYEVDNLLYNLEKSGIKEISYEVIVDNRENEYYIKVNKYKLNEVEFNLMFIGNYDSWDGTDWWGCEYSIVKPVTRTIVDYKELK